MADTLKKHGMPALGWWLMAVGTFRIGVTFLSFFIFPSCTATFTDTPVSDEHGRTVAVWTLLSCTLCFLCAFNLDSKPVYEATLLSFVYALGYLSTECVVYHTIAAATLAPFIFIAGTSIVWMLLQWNSLGHGAHPCGATSKRGPDPIQFYSIQ